jgi:PleD family two-component response regulator
MRVPTLIPMPCAQILFHSIAAFLILNFLTAHSLMNKVLIIDDDPLYRKVIGEILEKHGWKVFDAEEGEAGVEL